MGTCGLKVNDKQGTSQSSRFLDTCGDFSKNKISIDELRTKTVALGFNNVIDAFHIVGKGEIPIRFFCFICWPKFFTLFTTILTPQEKNVLTHFSTIIDCKNKFW